MPDAQIILPLQRIFFLSLYATGYFLKKYVVHKVFTVWTTRKKHKVGEEVFIGEHNEKLYEWAIDNKFLRPADQPKKR